MRTGTYYLAAVLLFGWVFCPPSSAQELAPKLLGKVALDAKPLYAKVGPEKVADAHEHLKGVANELDAYLSKGNTANGLAWKKFLKWDDLVPTLTDKPGAEPAKPAELLALRGVLTRFRSGEFGLELDIYADVRRALSRYIDTRVVSADTNAKKRYEALLDAVAKDLDALHAKPSSALAEQIGVRLDLLERSDQASDLVSAVRQQYQQTNLYLQASHAFINEGFSKSVDDKQQVNQKIMRTSLYGTAHTIGDVSVDLLESTTRAEILINFDGTATSSNVGYNGPATIYSSAHTEISATQLIWVDEDGLHGDSANADCATTSTINSIATKPRFLRKFAWKQARRKKGQTQAIANANAERRVERRVDETTNELLKKANENLNEKFLGPLGRQDGEPRLLQFSTNPELLQFEMLHAVSHQLAAPGPPPALKGKSDLSLRLHQSLVGNLSGVLIGGQTVTDEQLAELIEETTGEVPEELKITQDTDPWSITFATLRPISIEVDDQTVRIAIRGKRFTRADQKIKSTVEIAAMYDVKRTKEGSTMARKGDVEVNFLRVKGKLSVSQTAFKTFMRKKFDGVFKKEFVGTGLELKGEWEKVGKLLVKQLDADNGWLTLAWAMERSVKTAKK